MTVDKLRELDKESFAKIGEAAKRKTTDNIFDVSNDQRQIIRDESINLSRYKGSRAREQWNIIPDEVKAVWSKPEVRNISKSFMLRDDENFYGFVNKNGAGEITEFFVAHNNDHAALTAVHETGHLIDTIYLTDAQRKQILDVVKTSREYGTINAEYERLQNKPKLTNREKRLFVSLKDIRRDDELIARSYTQFISERNTGELLEQLRKDAILNGDINRFFGSVKANMAQIWIGILTAGKLL